MYESAYTERKREGLSLLLGEGNSQGLQAFPLQLPFVPCSRQHFQNQPGPKRQKKVSLLEIVAKLPSLEIRHLQPVGRIAANYIYPSPVDLLKVQGGSQVSEFSKTNC